MPIMLGTKDVAFPRLNLASWYVYVVGSSIGIFSIISGGVDTGWTFYTPYSSSTDTAVISMTFAVLVLGFSSIFTGINWYFNNRYWKWFLFSCKFRTWSKRWTDDWLK